jgi:hypothetical protein
MPERVRTRDVHVEASAVMAVDLAHVTHREGNVESEGLQERCILRTDIEIYCHRNGRAARAICFSRLRAGRKGESHGRNR